MPETQKSDLRLLLGALRDDATGYFQRVNKEAGATEEDYCSRNDADFYWRHVTDESLALAGGLADRLVRYSAQLAAAMRNAPLVSSEDAADLRESTKAMWAALRLHRYQFHDVEVINDEDRILGVRPARQSEDESLPPLEADTVFRDHTSQLLQTLKLVEASAELSSPSQEASGGQSSTQYRPGTGFIMMWMDPARPGLFDVVDAVKETFRQFGIAAVRADDIEHEGQITQRVLNEIRTAEFLFADLTGARPNVYYEVGFAHALRRPVILYRQSGTGLHFDLAGYNCPEYTNMRDLKDKLRKRLESMTNRSADQGAGDT